MAFMFGFVFGFGAAALMLSWLGPDETNDDGF